MLYESNTNGGWQLTRHTRRAETWLARSLCSIGSPWQLPKMALAGPQKWWNCEAQAGPYLTVLQHWHVAVEFFLIPISQMGMPATVWAQMLGKPVHTDTQGEGRRADWHWGAPGSEEHLPLHQAPLSLRCQPARCGHKEPAGTSTPGSCCHCYHIAQSSPKTKLMPFCHTLPMSDHKLCNSQCIHDQFVFVHLPALSLNSCFPLHCIYPLLI